MSAVLLARMRRSRIHHGWLLQARTIHPRTRTRLSIIAIIPFGLSRDERQIERHLREAELLNQLYAAMERAE